MRASLFLCLAVAITGTAIGAEPPARGIVSEVVDGDTVIVTNVGRVRIADIDAPELSQPWGPQAKSALMQMIQGAEVRLDYDHSRSYGRVVAILRIGRRSAAREMVRQGLAWVDPRYCRDLGLYRDEATARAERRGLWSEAGTTAPWVWRRAGVLQQ